MAETENRAAVVARLTAPGAPFEVVEEPVRGAVLRVFKNRHRSLRELLVRSERHGAAEYLVGDERRLTFAEHAAAVARLAQAFRAEYKVRPGDRVAILAANCVEWIVSFWAATSLGAVAVGLNSRWTAAEIAHGVSDCDPTLLVADAPRRALLDTRLPVLSTEEDIPALAYRDDAPPTLPESSVDEDDPAVILYTSGTTGRPKGAVHSHRNVLAAVDFHLFNDAVATAFGNPPAQRRFLLVTPLFHIAGLHNLAVPRIAVGDTAVLHTGRFDIERVLRLIERERVTNWGAVPTMANRLLRHGDLSGYDLSSLRTMSLNSAPSSPTLIEQVRARLPDVGTALATTYGLTESTTGATTANAADLAHDPHTVGRAAVNTDVEIRDAEGVQVPDGVEGEVWLRGPQMMLGYWRAPQATAEMLVEDGWLRTGDLGTVHDGLLRISSRRSDLILRGGENVYPAEVEEALERHPAVIECTVVGTPHEDLGEEVAAIVVVPEGSDVDEGQLAAWLREYVAAYKVPSRWHVSAETLPRNATGKVERHRVARRLTDRVER